MNHTRTIGRRSKLRSGLLCLLCIAVVGFAASVLLAAPAAAKTKNTIKITNLTANHVYSVGERAKAKTKITGKYAKQAVKFSSSDYTVASILKDGTIVPLKKGTVTITACVKKKTSIKTSVKIKVGTKAQTVTVSGRQLLRAGLSTTLSAELAPADAYYKTVKWTSSNTAVATVNSSGKVTGKKAGTVTIRATAADGSGAYGTFQVNVFSMSSASTHWIAHRGLCTDAVENTADAFKLAGKYKFWGCECDVWETKPEEVQINPDQTGTADAENPQANATDEGQISSGTLTPPPAEETTFFTQEIVVNHDEDFSRLFGVDRKVKEMTATEIRQNKALAEVCFLQDFLKICNQYSMVPVIELKDPEMSEAAIQQTVDAVYAYGGDALAKAMFVSFYPDPCVKARKYAQAAYGVTPVTSLIIGSPQYKGDHSELRAAKNAGFTGVSLSRVILSDDYAVWCHNNGLHLYTWTYENTLSHADLLYQQVVGGQYGIEAFSTNGKLFQ